MKRKALMLALIIAGSCTVTACGGKKAGSVKPKPSHSKTETTEAPTEEATEPETEAETAAPTTTAPTEPVTAAATEPFKQDEGGAVEFSAPQKEMAEKDILEAARAAYDKACEVEWAFTVGTPYELDYDSYIEDGQFGWQFYLVTTKGINKISDVMDEYHGLFSENRETYVSQRYIENKGRLYCMPGARGSNIFYDKSEVTGIVSRSDDAITFSVTVYYDGSDFAQESYTEKNDFSLVRGKDGKWRVEKFTLPY